MSGDGPPLHVMQVLGDFGLGGDGRVARDLSTALHRRGVRATCVALRSRGAAAPPPGGYEVVRLPADEGRLGFARAARAFRKRVHETRPDVVHVHGPRSLLFVASALLGLRLRPQLWFTWHDSGAVLEMGALRDAAARWALRRCTHVFGSSSDVAERLQDHLPRGVRVEVFRNGVEDVGPTRGMADPDPVVVWAARWVPPKDPLVFLRTVATLRAEGVRFRVVMAGKAPPNLAWFERQVREFLDDAALADVVETPGWLADLSPLWQTGAVSVQTSLTEGLSITLLESMMAGLAVVATDVGDTAAAVEDDVCGLLVPPGDEAALTKALRRVLADREVRVRLGAAARTCAQDRFSLDAMADQVLGRLGADGRSRGTPPGAALGRGGRVGATP